MSVSRRRFVGGMVFRDGKHLADFVPMPPERGGGDPEVWARRRVIRPSMLDNPCEGCGNGMPADECRLSPRTCGHHCDCSFDQDHCCFCGQVFGEWQDYPPCYDCVGMGV